MAISVEVPQLFRKHTNGSRMLTVEGATIREVFQRLETPLQEGDSLSILPAVAGGRPWPSVPAAAGHGRHGQAGAGAGA